MLEQQRDYVLHTVEERGVRLIRLWFTDVLGSLKSFAISPAELENALEDGMTFDGSSIDGFGRMLESDVLAMPDANTFEVLPWGAPNVKGHRGPGLLRHPQPRHHAVRRRPAPGAAPQPASRPRARITRSTWHPISSSSTSPRQNAARGRCRWTRAGSST